MKGVTIRSRIANLLRTMRDVRRGLTFAQYLFNDEELPGERQFALPTSSRSRNATTGGLAIPKPHWRPLQLAAARWVRGRGVRVIRALCTSKPYISDHGAAPYWRQKEVRKGRKVRTGQWAPGQGVRESVQPESHRHTRCQQWRRRDGASAPDASGYPRGQPQRIAGSEVGQAPIYGASEWMK